VADKNKARDAARDKPNEPPGQIGQVVQLVKDYARQETLGPLKGAGRWIGFGIAGALLIGLATAFLVLGVLRMVQAEFAPTFSGRWMSLLPYVIALVFSLLVAATAASRIGKKSLQKEKP
jgi:hypothetical protein